VIEVKITKKDVVFDGEYLRLVRKHLETGSGEQVIWETLERKNVYNKGAVVIIASTKERKLILEKELEGSSGVVCHPISCWS
jgi:spore coat polysaccharide biosynthesis protein SpsF (cytidylyltransferase family)